MSLIVRHERSSVTMSTRAPARTSIDRTIRRACSMSWPLVYQPSFVHLSPSAFVAFIGVHLRHHRA